MYERVWAAVRLVPRGRVVTYGDVAAYVGCGARQVGYALSALPDRPHRVPWQRVIGGHGTVSERRGGDGAVRQRAKLEAEGVSFTRAGKLDLDRLRWRFPPPDDGQPSPGDTRTAPAPRRLIRT